MLWRQCAVGIRCLGVARVLLLSPEDCGQDVQVLAAALTYAQGTGGAPTLGPLLQTIDAFLKTDQIADLLPAYGPVAAGYVLWEGTSTRNHLGFSAPS